MMAQPGTLSDVKSIGKCSDFSGHDADWLNWKFKFEAWFVLALGDTDRDVDALLKGAEEHDGPIVQTDLSDNQVKAARILYAALVNLCRGKALTIARRCGRGDGVRAMEAVGRGIPEQRGRENYGDACGRADAELGREQAVPRRPVRVGARN